jgi:1D-myo-inositol 3-kinase
MIEDRASQSNRLTCLAVGHVTHDRLDDEIVPGGCAFYAARTFEALGARSRLITSIGNDFVCESALEKLEVRAQRSGKTTVFTNLYPQNGQRVQYVEAVAGSIVPNLLPTEWTKPDVIFIGPVICETDLKAWKATSGARLVAVGVQGFVRGVAGQLEQVSDALQVVPRKWSPDREMLDGVDIVFLSEEDLDGQGNLLQLLCDSIPLVALTRERKGCDIIERGKKTWVGIHPAHEVDPTGAGDTFAAGFLFALAQGKNPVESAKLGAAAASIIIEGRSGENFSKLSEAFERANKV